MNAGHSKTKLSFQILIATLLLLVLSSMAVGYWLWQKNVTQADTDPEYTPAITVTSSTPTPTASPTTPADSSSITLEHINNIEYSVSATQKVQLKNGEATFSVPGTKEKGSASVSNYALGDINGDGKGDAVVILRTNFGGTGFFPSTFIVLYENGKPSAQLSATPAWADRDTIESVVINKGLVTISATIHDPEDSSCCATLKSSQTYKLSGKDLIVANPVSTETFSKQDLPSNLNLLNKINVDLDKDSQEEIVLWVEDTSKVGYLAQGGKGDDTFHPAQVMVMHHSIEGWKPVNSLNNTEIGNRSGLTTGSSGVYEIHPMSSFTINGAAVMRFAIGGSRPGEHWFVMNSKGAAWPNYNPKVSYNNRVSVSGDIITDQQAVYTTTDNNQNPTGGTDNYQWKLEISGLQQQSKTHSNNLIR